MSLFKLPAGELGPCVFWTSNPFVEIGISSPTFKARDQKQH